MIDGCTELRIKPYNAAPPAQAIALPADQTDGAWTKPVHQDAEWKRGGAEQEGANGETQIQHLFLVHAGEIFFDLVAGGRVAQRHDHGIVLCEEGQRARSQERKTWTPRAALAAALAQYNLFWPCDWLSGPRSHCQLFPSMAGCYSDVVGRVCDATHILTVHAGSLCE